MGIDTVVRRNAHEILVINGVDDLGGYDSRIIKNIFIEIRRAIKRQKLVFFSPCESLESWDDRVGKHLEISQDKKFRDLVNEVKIGEYNRLVRCIDTIENFGDYLRNLDNYGKLVFRVGGSTCTVAMPTYYVTSLNGASREGYTVLSSCVPHACYEIQRCLNENGVIDNLGPIYLDPKISTGEFGITRSDAETGLFRYEGNLRGRNVFTFEQ